jgi:hypothetical protein
MLAATVALVGCAVTTSVIPVVPVAAHVAYPAGTACDATGCHTPDYFKPAYTHKEPYLGPCDLCHNTVAWKQVTYKHKAAGFDNGMHAVVGCAKCHTEGTPSVPPVRGCVVCHTPQHKGWESCGSCHTTFAFRMFNAPPAGHLSLLGGHATLSCLDCHTAKTEPATPRQCVDCHGTHHGGLTTCQDCHTPDAGKWVPKPGWSHSKFFVLRGFHKTLECAQCHINDRFAGTPKVCVGCHGRMHGGLTDCGGCHNTTAFKPATFRHSSVWTLTGTHAELKCSKCHPDASHNRVFARHIGTGGTNCNSCHPIGNPGSEHGGLTNCGACHNTTSFDPATKFHHSSFFRLLGVHTTLACAKCHTGGAFTRLNFTNTSGQWKCVDCHLVHHGNQTECTNCHQPTAWADTLPIVHPAANIPLGPSHAWPNPCDRCHPGNNFDTTAVPTTPCENCHGAGAPGGGQKIPHVGPTHCLSCHLPTVWADVRNFTHPRIFGDLLLAGYVGTSHEYTEFGGYPTGCILCHTSSGPNPDFTAYSCTAAGCHN